MRLRKKWIDILISDIYTIITFKHTHQPCIHPCMCEYMHVHACACAHMRMLTHTHTEADTHAHTRCPQVAFCLTHVYKYLINCASPHQQSIDKYK